ncbi:tyrosinase family protein [Gloeocapsopsis dulcis]|uniref:Catechol oxidase n=1 Tax=Gloeocapsopsis dulcis AAB1 = 1H9 TaxID=1433147 RepID=A0A6N8FVU8_9CHRO|nr:tyrosinase family protein [Gloeocapsopsis dulcis]MUL36989.1 catechol oxidase [Gloeocapsopsis dulcis AAB1 = 1H9]WNN87842.1 tyrosinase family protein [Gloeocapsopsis dulcis]
MASSLSRREVLRLLSFLSAGAAGVGSVPFISSLANQANAQTSSVYVRENIATFMRSPAKIAALRRGVRVMLSRSSADPRSWIYQANMHGIPSNESRRLAAWGTCSHGSFFFFPWHRMYLYYFERILRQASGDPTLALPYWNYSDFPDQRSLPEPFRNRLLPDDSTNSLYVEQRAPGINQGTTALASAEVSYSAAFQRTNFFHTSSGQQSFGGLRVTGSTHRGSGGGLLEGRPHNQVHTVVGGSSGWMRQVEMAARDPIFWLHHSNIDRLWGRWLSLEGGRANPLNDSDWINDRFTFFDENGRQVTMRGRDIINTVQQLNYRYDDAPMGNQMLVSGMSSAEPSSQATTATPQLLATTPMNNQQMLVELRETPVTLTLRFPESQGYRVFSARASAVSSLTLNVEKVEYNPRNSIPYEIYINLPQGVPPNRNSPYYVGRLALFAHPQKATFRLDISEAVNELQRRNLITGDSISVTFVPPAEEVNVLQRADRSRQLPGVVRFERVTITTLN